MSRKYNKTYKKGKYLNSELWHKYRNNQGLSKSEIADKAKLAKIVYNPNSISDRARWRRDPRKSDLMGIDTPPTKGQKVFNYKYRSKKRLGKKTGRENKSWRRYWIGRK